MTNPYLTPSRIKAALRELALKPTRAMGQNFLADAGVLATIVAAAELTAGDTVLEIGPGLGVLTWELLNSAGRVVAVELDHRLAERLRGEFTNTPQLSLVQGDILRFAPGELVSGSWQVNDHRPPTTDQQSSAADVRHSSLVADHRASSQPYKVVANLPYAITSPVLRHLLEATQPPTLIVVLVQWEVAQRIAAGPGDLSVLAHAVQLYAVPEVVARVAASAFLPAPAVDSAVLRLRLRPHPVVAASEIVPVMRLIKAGFLQARKQLGNALPSGLAAMGNPLEKPQALAALMAAGIAPERRAETLTLEEWLGLYRAIADLGSGYFSY